MLADGTYKVFREAQDGARWEGVAEVKVGRVVDRGAWVMADGKRMEGMQEMLWAGDLLTVAQPHASHVYMLLEVEDGFVGQYDCGDDVYFVWSEVPQETGWKMRFEVAGPNKDGWQDVRYERQLGQ